MNAESKKYISLFVWIVGLILIGSIIGSLTKTEVNAWYDTLNLSPPHATKLCISNRVGYSVRDNCYLWVDHLAPAIFSRIAAYKELIYNAVNFKLELDAFIFSLSLNRIFPLCVYWLWISLLP